MQRHVCYDTHAVTCDVHEVIHCAVDVYRYLGDRLFKTINWIVSNFYIFFFMFSL